MSFLTEKTAALVDAVQQYEQKAQELLSFRSAIEAAHKDLGAILSPEQPAPQEQEAPTPEQQEQG